MSDEQRRRDFADFLRTRRLRLSPEEVGLARGGRRRTPGLRREEVAERANVGVSWYTLLEQGRDVNPSREVLQSIADALQLTPDERQHLFFFANQPYLIETAPSDELVSPALRRVLDALTPTPAYIIDRRWNYLAWNATASQIFLRTEMAPPYEYNVIWRIFTDPEIRLLNKEPTWEQVALQVMEEFRAESARYADEEWFKRLIADLQRVSPEFRAWWPHHNVRGRADAHKTIEHPLVGCLMFEHTTLQVPAQPELKVMIYTPLPQTGTLKKLQQLMFS
ncbi:helix-turn-helix transcriptional regulator [Tengunoibacter tsumagoiensis]|uniref:Transcriptional regulator n=1 Tax=Tengunoibacter tsumagoiensis TaxID=2014871 RepID=A0A402A8Z7_9CHLR|nr:helix-turn-helix transcriptional regulator [Tengunoibacter tsumagoiensis]GCE15647.1 transcriptional regulator [Tengunoibacter tsumagoiensis]